MRSLVLFCVGMLSFIVMSPAFAMKGGSTALRAGSRAVIGIFDCSAVIIHPRVIATAAHCVEPRPSAWKDVAFFTNRFGATALDIETIVVHPKFVAASVEGGGFRVNDDIAVIILKTAIDDAQVLANIPRLATAQDLRAFESDSFTATGMGMMKVRRDSVLGDLSNYERASTAYRITQIKSSVLFIEPETPGTGACFADSGGALYLEKNNETILVGIITMVSSTLKGWCALKNETAYAESVAHQLNFLRESARKSGIELNN